MTGAIPSKTSNRTSLSGIQSKAASGIIPRTRSPGAPAQTPAAPQISGQHSAVKMGLNSAARSVHDEKLRSGFVPAIKHSPPPAVRGQSLSQLVTSIRLNCKGCGKSILDAGPDSHVEKVKGGMLCATCSLLRKELAAARGRKTRTFAAITLVVLLAVGAVFPGQAFFALSLAGILVAGTGLLAHDWRRVVRLALVSVGLVVLAGGGVGVAMMSSKGKQDAVRVAMTAETAAINDLLKANKYPDAVGRVRAFEDAVASGEYNGDADAAAQTVTQLQQRLEDWIKEGYGALNDEERALLTALASRYPDLPGSTQRRIAAFSYRDNLLNLKLQLPSDATEAARVTSEARAVLVYVLDAFPAVKRIHLELGSGGASDFNATATYDVSRDQSSQIRFGNLPQKAGTK